MGSSQSKNNKTSSPSEPTATSPSEPTTGSLSEPTTGSLSDSTTRSPSEPTSSPSKSTTSTSEPTSSPSESTSTSSKPATTAPSEQTATFTSESTTSSPSEPTAYSPSEPASSTSKPTTSSTSDPTTSSTSEPTTSSTSEPTTSSPSEPTAYSPSEPASSTSEPTTSSTSEPTTSSTSEPTANSTSEPTTSSPSEPTAYSPSEAASSTSEPTTSSTSEPTISTSEPTTSSTSEPTTSSSPEQTSSLYKRFISFFSKLTTSSSSKAATSSPSELTTNTPPEPTTSSNSELTTSSNSEPTTGTSSEPTTSSSSEQTSSSSAEPPTTCSPSKRTSSPPKPTKRSPSETTPSSPSEPTTSTSSEPTTSFPPEQTSSPPELTTSPPPKQTTSSTSGSTTSSISGSQTGPPSRSPTSSTSESEGPASLNEQTNDQSKNLQLLLVGSKGNGKSHTGNTILGLKVFPVTRRGGTQKARLESSSCCMGKQVSRKVIVVDTPGVSQEMTESEFEELVRAVKMVPEGFDAICLVWNYDSSDKGEDKVKKEVKVFQSLRRLFGAKLHKHLVILVTHAQQEQIDEFITGLPEAMSEIVSGCDHVLAIENKPDGDSSVNKGQVDKLFECCETMSGKYIDSDLKCQINGGNKLQIALVGKTGVGKSHTGNTIICNDKFKVGDRASPVTTKCNFGYRRKDREICVLDTPGVFSTDDHRLVKMTKELCRMGGYICEAGGLDALVVVVSSRVKFTESETKAVKFFQHLFGSTFANYAILLVTGKDNLRETTENDFLTSDNMRIILEQCGNRCVFFDNTTRDETLKRQQLIKLIQMIDQRVAENTYKPLAENTYKPYTDDHFQEGKRCMEGILEEAKNQNLTWSQIAEKLEAAKMNH